MKRLHVSLTVGDLAASVRFYAGLFGAAPTVLKDDYAKWLIDDPAVNFSLTARGKTPGLAHLGIQAETPDELAELRARIAAAGGPALDEGEVICCYARSDKAWAIDPQGVRWEAFHTLAASDSFGEETADEDRESARCCPPEAQAEPATECCTPTAAS